MWGEVWRVGVAAIVGVLALMLIFGFLLDQGFVTDSLHAGVVVLADIALGLVAILLVPLRRLAPLPIGIIVGVIGGFSLLAVGAAGIVLISVATRRRWREIAAVLAAYLASVAVVESNGLSLTGEPSSAGDLALSLTATALALAALTSIGMYIGGRRELLASLRERARLVEEEQTIRLAGEREQERARIAREMHDVLAHRLSLVALHAGALEHRPDLDQAETARTAAVVRDNARLALDELRDVLGVLREPAAHAVELPQPSLRDLPELIEQARAEGADLTVELSDDTRERFSSVPPSSGRHAFRIIQECLTNARRHAPGLAVVLAIDGHPGGGLSIEVRNALPAGAPTDVPAGHGLVGMEERALSVGGDYLLRRTPDEHAVIVVLPWPNP